MSIYLRLVIGPVVICDLEMFSAASKPDPNQPPAQLAGGSGQMMYPDPVPALGFAPPTP